MANPYFIAKKPHIFTTQKILSTLIFALLFSYSNLFAQDSLNVKTKNSIFKPTVRVLFDVIVPTPKFDSENYGISAFFRNQLKGTSYWSVNAGYIHYSDDTKARNDYELTVGFGNISYPVFDINFNFGFDLGILYRTQDSYHFNNNFYDSSNGLEFIWGVNSGFIFRLSNHFNMDWLLKLHFISDDWKRPRPGVSVGLSYSL